MSERKFCIALVFCRDLSKDPASRHVLDQTLALYNPDEIGPEVDGTPIQTFEVPNGTYKVLILENVLSHCYERYYDSINNHCSDCDAVFILNWHEGAKAPDSIFTVQTSGDIKSGYFSPVDPQVTRAAFLAIENARKELELKNFQTWTEATHWSGVIYGNQPGSNVDLIKPSVIDIEIGSNPQDWANAEAAKVLAHSFSKLPAFGQSSSINLLCFGGQHFESAYRDLVLLHGEDMGLSIAHILPNHWLVSEGYDDPARLVDLQRCYDSIVGGVEALIFHDNLKSSYKNIVKQFAEIIGVPAISHKKVKKNPEILIS